MSVMPESRGKKSGRGRERVAFKTLAAIAAASRRQE
jgi:hypothetical protein